MHLSGADHGRLSGCPDDEQPATGINDQYAVWHEDYERQLRAEVPDYAGLEQEAVALLGKSKPAQARYCAEKLVERDEVPPSLRALLKRTVALVETSPPAAPPPSKTSDSSDLSDEIPF